jgi:hypothetical protein
MTSRQSISGKCVPMLRAKTRIVAGWLVVCLFLQATVPGLLVTSANCGAESDSAVAGSCRLTGNGPGCCCGPSESDRCNCCCSRKSPPKPALETQHRSGESKQAARVGPAFCGCRGKSQSALVVASEPAVLSVVDRFLLKPVTSEVSPTERFYSSARPAPPTPPPEFSV